MSNEKFECLILAGGRGTRLQRIDSSRPKPLISVLGLPFIDYQLKLLRKQGLKRILISTGYMGDQMDNYIKKLKLENMHISTIHENYPLGTGGAIKNAIDFLDDEVLVCNGDTIAFFDLREMFSFHKKRKSNLTILIRQIEQSSRYGIISLDLDDDRIVAFQEKSDARKSWISAGYFILAKKKISWDDYPESFSYEELLFPDLVRNGKAYGFKFDDYFIDVGTPDSYNQFINDVTSKRVDFS
ncbi:nucleotidyltransferase family protein [Candidatus Nitrosotalea okcheonensis]|uniref:Putative D-glycero-alpha-D-manno-heptose 1-phosphate guanylyltransferase n=1 Tax=Candidatus Nitrosotalea okcheonensis TaxID=1903276 RepID=A0A2H1FHU5_9ARCH|nr:sugar phosphate nucleotidyltransferase [Candidatus Nitrosotalea okcheonensis]SMH72304.1 putative D-glycero-alpha-D-manno-heptose 1-phosphate guanylyltransferase [Candidatus Nitrosotalea okcheonensis]